MSFWQEVLFFSRNIRLSCYRLRVRFLTISSDGAHQVQAPVPETSAMVVLHRLRNSRCKEMDILPCLRSDLAFAEATER